MNETYVTVVGYAGTNPILTTSGKPYATFRLGSTRRIRRDGEWVDSPTAWYSVKAWGSMAHNVAESIRKSDPVIVTGEIVPEMWNDRIELTLHASAIGPNLATGTARFAKVDRRTATAEADDNLTDGVNQVGSVGVTTPLAPGPDETDPFAAQNGEPPF